MRALSISQAWDETKAILVRDGRLFASVALALVALPARSRAWSAPRGWRLVGALVGRRGHDRRVLDRARRPAGADPPRAWRRRSRSAARSRTECGGCRSISLPRCSSSSGCSLPRSLRRHPGSPWRAAAGEGRCRRRRRQRSPCCFIVVADLLRGVRMLMSAPVASAEAGRTDCDASRSWDLTAGQLVAAVRFLVMIFVAAFVLAIAVGGVSES